MIKLQNITKLYGPKKVVDDVSIELPKKKLIAFIGSNGAGKSTLISMIGRTLSKSEGEVVIDEKKLSDWNSNELAKRLSILKQSNHLNIRLTVRELVTFGRYPHSKGKITAVDTQHIDESIAYMELEGLQDRYLDELSGGQRQMAYIAMVIAQDTEYIFLDEPLNNLDMRHSVQIMRTLKKLVNDLNKTVMIVIHDINFVSCYADYVIAMKDGKIAKAGDTKLMIQSQVLENIYGMQIDIHPVNGKNICLYYG